MNPHIIIMACLVLWYCCVLIVWMWLGRSMNLFGNHSLYGWMMVAAAFAVSMAVNFILNPLAWIVAALSIRTAKDEMEETVWRFYLPSIGILLTVLIVIWGVVTLTRGQITGTQKVPAGSFFDVPAGDASSGDHQTLSISGIMYSNDPSALINGRVLKEGDWIGEVEVIEIRQNMVVFRDKDGKVFEQR